MSKKILAMITGLVLALSLSGCNQSENSRAVEEVSIAEEKSITFATNFGFSKKDTTMGGWCDVFKEQTGCEIEIDSLTGTEYYQVLDYTLAMGRAHDLIAISEGKLPSYVVDDELLDITDMVNESEILAKIPKDAMESATVGDRIYGVPVEFGGGTVTYVRQDILDALQLSVPNNFDEYISMLEKIKSAYPDMIPYTAPALVGASAEYYLIDFYQDASPEIIEVNGKWVDGMLEENMKPALERLRLAYSKGLIDPEITSNGTKKARTKFMEGKAAVFNYWAGSWNLTLQQGLTKNLGETAKITPIKPIQNVIYKIRPSVVLAITKNANNPERVFKNVLEYMHDGAEGSLLFQHGVEGVHYKKEGNQIVHLKNGEKEYPNVFIRSEMAFETTEYTYNLNPDSVHSLDLLKENGKQEYNLPSSVTYTAISSELTELRTQTIASVMIGTATIDEALATYKQKSEELGIAKVLEEMNA